MTKRALIAGVFAAVWTWGAAPPPGLAQQVVGQNVIRIPGIGVVDLDKLPPEVRDNIRIPGRSYQSTQQEYGQRPPLAVKAAVPKVGRISAPQIDRSMTTPAPTPTGRPMTNIMDRLGIVPAAPDRGAPSAPARDIAGHIRRMKSGRPPTVRK